MLTLEYRDYTLQFKFDAGTSRGVLKTHRIVLLRLSHSSRAGVYGIGEAAPLANLSSEKVEDLLDFLPQLASQIQRCALPASPEEALRMATEWVPARMPSLRFGLEMALLDWVRGGRQVLFETPFVQGIQPIPINGLIWMGSYDFMKKQVDEKLEQGFSCIKLKVGAIDFQQELRLLEYIRSQSSQVTLRVDANGAFPVNEALARLKDLERFHLHSIEQPIMPRQPEAMQLLCNRSKVPIALDEELIGVTGRADKEELLDTLLPPYLVLKPTLLGGILEAIEWIQLAEARGIGWWLTSALESNIGLNAIAQFAATWPMEGYQGLGTGQLYHNNFESPLRVEGGYLEFRKEVGWESCSKLFE